MPQQGKLIAAVMIVFLLLTVLFAGISARREERRGESEEIAEENFTQYPYMQLKPNERELYQALYKGISACAETIRLPGEYTDLEYEKVYLLLSMQEPQFFYLDEVYELQKIMDTATMHYRMTKDEIKTYREQLADTAAEILRTIETGNHAADQLCTLHDEIASRCVYSEGANEDNIVGCLLEGRAKCEGYAKAFLYLTRMAGYSSMCVTGVSKRGVLHVWNAVRIGELYYNVDVTWDDDPAYHGGFVHSCMAVPDQDFEDHIADRQTFSPPNCYSYLDNYYERNGRVLRSYAMLMQSIAMWRNTDGGKVIAEFQCEDRSVFEQVRWGLRNDTEVQWQLQSLLNGQIPEIIFDSTRQTAVLLRRW